MVNFCIFNFFYVYYAQLVRREIAFHTIYSGGGVDFLMVKCY